jgi:hypothetical protein
MRSAVAPLLLLLVTAGSAAADATYALGVRVGGRMNGVGIFGSRALPGPFFIEGGLDVYTSQNFPVAPAATDLPISRMSGLVSTAAGIRTNFTSWLRGYAQIGGGIELTRVAVPYGDGTTIRDDKAMPEGFFGIGADLKVGSATYVGASFRTLVMGNFDYDASRLQMSNAWVSPPPARDVFAASPDLAAQGQFYLRHDL